MRVELTKFASIQPLAAARAPMRCGDPDDQKFIDLAVETQAQWLVTKDRELLKLAKRALRQGVSVVRPAQWMAPETAAPLQASAQQLTQ